MRMNRKARGVWPPLIFDSQDARAGNTRTVPLAIREADASNAITGVRLGRGRTTECASAHMRLINAHSVGQMVAVCAASLLRTSCHSTADRAMRGNARVAERGSAEQ